MTAENTYGYRVSFNFKTGSYDIKPATPKTPDCQKWETLEEVTAWVTANNPTRKES